MLAKLNGSRTILMLALVACAGAATTRGAPDAGKDTKGAEELKKFQGEWTAPSAGTGEVTYTFKDDKLNVKAPTRSYEITVKLDAAAEPDKTIDMKIDEAPEDAKGKTSKGIYKFDGEDKLVICFRPEGERPTKYEMIGFEQIVVELTREKAEQK